MFLPTGQVTLQGGQLEVVGRETVDDFYFGGVVALILKSLFFDFEADEVVEHFQEPFGVAGGVAAYCQVLPGGEVGLGTFCLLDEVFGVGTCLEGDMQHQ